MTETATTEETTYTAEEIQKMWEALPESVRDAISNINANIDAHNTNVALIKASQGDDAKKLLFELRDQNPKGDEKLGTFLTEIEKLNERIEALTAQANKRAETVYADQLKTPSEAEVKAAREAVSKSGAEVRAAAKGTLEFEKFLNQPLSIHIKAIGTLKGTGGGKSSSTGEIWRPRTSAIYVNGELIQKDVQNPTTGVKEPKSTFNIVAAHLNKLTGGKNYATTDLQSEYLKAAGGDKDNLPESVEFVIPFTKGDATVEFTVKVEK